MNFVAQVDKSRFVAQQQIEKLQEQLQLAYTEETPEDESTTILSEETESIEKHTKKKQKWWQLWK